MSAADLQELKDQIDALRGQLDGITDAEWETYERVRDILRVARTIVEVPTVPQGFEADAAVAAAAGGTVPGYYITHPTSHACAMLGIFEPAQGQATSTEYDAAAVERFAALGG